MTKTERQEMLAARRRLKREWGAAYVRLSDILFTEDPAGINFETNSDEYEPEVETILPRLPSCRSKAEVREVIHQEFARWFETDDGEPPEPYRNIPRLVDRIWNEVLPMVRGIKAARK
jgi:hypothetical protein